MSGLTIFWKTGLRYGIYTALMILFFYMLVNFAGLGMSGLLNWTGYLILGVEIFFAQKYYQVDQAERMSFGRGLSIGLVVSLVCGFILGSISFLYIKLINREALQQIIDQYERALRAEGFTNEMVGQLMGTVHSIFTPEGLFLLTLFGLLFSGLIISLIVTAFARKSR